MTVKALRARLLGSSIICGAAAIAAPAIAQPAGRAPPAAGPSAQVEEVIVTGSRIPQPNLTSISPVQVLNSQEVTLSGRTVTADLLNQLPQLTVNSQADLGSTSNPLNGPGGVATVDLRGLGPQRTLVLVDGRRLGIGDPNTGNPNPAPDINQIPAQLIDRVDVLTGGASATYGSDAIAGVVNFIMRRNFEGFQVDVQQSGFQHGQHAGLAESALRTAGVPIPKDAFDGSSWDASLIWGRSFADGAGHLELYGTYHRQSPVLQGARDFSACQINVTAAGVPFCNGTTNSNIFYLSSGLGNQFAVSGNQFVIWNPGLVTNPPPLFNSNAFNTLIQSDTRWTGGYFAHWDIDPHVTVYSDFQYMHDRTDVPIAPSGLFQGANASATGGYLVNCNNPLLSAQQVTAIGCTPAQVAAGDSLDLFIGRRNVEGGPRASLYRHENYRVVLGARGTITGPWKYDIYASYYHTSLDVLLGNYVGNSRAQNALQVVQGPNGPVCISGGTCVPYNIFTEGGVTPAALESLLVSGRQHGESNERIIEGTITADLGEYGIRSPWATDGVGVAGGFQFRRDELTFTPDAISSTNELSGGGGVLTPVSGAINVSEGFAEVRAPLVQDMPYARDVQLEAGYRYSSYSTGFNTDTWKVGLQWAPTQDVRFRASYQVAVRAPNILELFTPRTVTNTSQLPEDPCAANAAQPATLQQCLNTGITPAQFGVVPNCPSNQCAVLTGGNPTLQPEHAKTTSIGASFTPRFIDGLTASVDYYHITLRGTIGAIPLGVTVQQCLTTGLPQFCSLITRTAGGTLFGSSITTGGFVDGTGVNIGSGRAAGIDVQINYNLPLSKFGYDNWGRLSFNMAGSYLLNAATRPLPGGAEYDCAGLFGPQCQSINPRWRHTLRVNWESPWNVLFSVAWRHFGSAKLETDTNEPTIGQGTTSLFNHILPSRDYMDVAAVWNMNKVLTLRAGVNNILDQDPPLVNAAIAGTGLPNTYPTYDLLGRRIFVGVSARF